MFPRFIQIGSAWQLQLDKNRNAGQKVLSKAAARDLITKCLMDFVITEAEFTIGSNEIETSTMQETQLVRSCHRCRRGHQFWLGGGRWSEKFLDVQSGMSLARQAMRNGELLPNQVEQIRDELHRLGVPIQWQETASDDVILGMWVIVEL